MENKTEQQVNETAIQDVEIMSEASVNKRSTLIWIWLAMLMLLCSYGGMYWLWVKQQSYSEKIDQQLAAVQTDLSDNAQLKQLLQDTNTKIKQQLTTLQIEQQALAEKVLTLRNSHRSFPRDDVQQYWAIAEIEYLLNIANQRVLYAGDTVGARTILAIADERVKALSDHRLHSLRALLAKEQLALAAVAEIDIEGMTLQLQSALNSIDNLQVLMASPVMSENKSDRQAGTKTGQNVVEQIWSEIKSLVVIRHQQDAPAVVLIPEQRYFLYQNLRLKLEAARFALLSGKPVVFNASLESVVQWLEQYFVGDDRDALLAMVTTLKSQSTALKIPDISGSLRWIKGFEQ